MAKEVNEYLEAKRDLTSDFNEAKLQVFRLNNSWERFSTAIRSGKFMDDKGANWELDDIHGELSHDEELQDEHKLEIEKYSYKINKLNGLIAEYRDDDTKLYKILRMKERILRRLQDEAGKGSKRSSEDEDDIDT
ncbi:unnamed protein product [marine sediment metagenome]|uniref:Uncharacterized protein n=1 Tax=marine sediment metagenome TaxID=412755 RepID=X0Z6Y8_9ZZZZ